MAYNLKSGSSPIDVCKEFLKWSTHHPDARWFLAFMWRRMAAAALFEKGEDATPRIPIGSPYLSKLAAWWAREKPRPEKYFCQLGWWHQPFILMGKCQIHGNQSPPAWIGHLDLEPTQLTSSNHSYWVQIFTDFVLVLCILASAQMGEWPCHLGINPMVNKGFKSKHQEDRMISW